MSELYRNQTTLSQEGYEQLAKWRQGEYCKYHRDIAKGTSLVFTRCAHLDDFMVEESYVYLARQGKLVDRAIYLCRKISEPKEKISELQELEQALIETWYVGDTDETIDQVWERMNQRMREEVERAERPTR